MKETNHIWIAEPPYKLNCTPKVRQCDTLNNERGAVLMSKGEANKKYTGEFKQEVIEPMQSPPQIG